jgi:hypothetical protein
VKQKKLKEVLHGYQSEGSPHFDVIAALMFKVSILRYVTMILGGLLIFQTIYSSVQINSQKFLFAYGAGHMEELKLNSFNNEYVYDASRFFTTLLKMNSSQTVDKNFGDLEKYIHLESVLKWRKIKKNLLDRYRKNDLVITSKFINVVIGQNEDVSKLIDSHLLIEKNTILDGVHLKPTLEVVELKLSAVMPTKNQGWHFKIHNMNFIPFNEYKTKCGDLCLIK